MNRQQGTKRSREYQDDLQDVPCNDQSRPILEFNQCMIGVELPAQQEARRQQTLLSSSRNKRLNATTREMITTRSIVTMSATVTNNCPSDNRRIKRRFSKVGDMFRNNSLNCSPYHSPWDISIPSSSRSPYSNHSLRMMIEETLNEHQEPAQIEHSHTTSRRRRGKKVQRRFSPINREKMDKFGIKCSSISENQVWSMMSSSSSDSLFFKEGEEARRENTTMNRSAAALITDSRSSSFGSNVVSLSSSLSSSSTGVDDLTHSLDEVINF